ncbi:MAG: InlB B-repeat-containing protein [Lachnospiraceae bacterium]|nr:InlB B-repeat-containing protein [Lachnospiraceae bacterium]
MRKLWFRRALAAVLAFSLTLSCAGIDTAFAEPTGDAEEAVMSVDEEQESIEPGTEIMSGEGDEITDETSVSDDEVSDDDISADEPSEEAEDDDTVSGDVIEDDGDLLSGNEVSEDEILAVSSVEELPVSERIISIEQKGSEEDAIDKLPDEWEVTLEDGSEKEVSVTWECLDDFDDDNYASFVFKGAIDDVSVLADLDDDEVAKLIMEIYFEDATVENEDGMTVSLLSPNSLMPQLETEQGTDGDTEAFLEAYGDMADEVISVTAANTANMNISGSAYSTLKGIGPTPDNYLYKKLSADERRFYNNIDKRVIQYLYYGAKCTKGVGGEPMTAYIPAGKLNFDQMQKVYDIYYFDNPQAFFLSTKINLYGGTGQSNSMSVTFLPDASTPDKMKAKAEEIAKNLKSLSTSVNKGSNEYNKALTAQKLLCKRVSIDQDYSYSPSKWAKWTEGNYEYDQSLMSVFSGKRKKTLSGGYAKAYTALARLAGIDAFGITSDGGREWNKVRLYGQWFCVDSMADDTDDISGSGCVLDHFMKSDSTVNKDGVHTWAAIWKSVAPKSAQNYSAKKTKRYTIKYKTNGGKNSKYNPSAYTAKADTIVLRNPTRTGYTFSGWYTDDDYSKRIKKIKPSGKKNYTLYAKWKIRKYKITYKLGGGKIKKGNPKSYTIKTRTITLKNPTRADYNFDGWYTSSGERIKKIQGKDAKNYTLTARWSLKKYKIKYYLNGGKNKGNPSYYTIKSGTIELKDPERTGYKFGGWYTDSALKKRIRKIKSSTRKPYTLYAKWTPITYRITYRLNGGTNDSGNPKTYNITTSKIVLKDPTKKDATFVGWYTDPEFSSGTRVKAINKGSTGNKVLYARWK